jgi:hypothetical protein
MSDRVKNAKKEKDANVQEKGAGKRDSKNENQTPK